MIWKFIPNTENRYMVSDSGDIKSLPFLKKGNKSFYLTKEKLIKLGTDKDGYKVFVYSIDSKRKTFRVHRLVAEAFIDNPNNYPVVNHKDGNPANNNKDNLEWCTISYNTQDAVDRGVMKPTNGEINGMSTLKKSDVLEIRRLAKETGLTHKEISEKFKVSRTNITKIINRKRWNHI